MCWNGRKGELDIRQWHGEDGGGGTARREGLRNAACIDACSGEQF